MKVNIIDLKEVYETEVRKNVKNKKKIFLFEKNKMEYFGEMKRVLENNLYDGGRYNIFLVFKPKIRVVMSQSIYDKVINHYVTRTILMPKLSKYLSDRCCATRKEMGTAYAIDLLKKDINYFKKYDEFYFLKIDIKKYFYNIDHNVLLHLLKNDLTSKEYNLIKIMLSSTNNSYINKVITRLEQNFNIKLPRYELNKGLSIGAMFNQFLAIFYLARLEHFMCHHLHLRFVNYMDDFVIIHEDKEYLKECLKIIEEKLKNEYKLELNTNKTIIVNAKYGINFLGYHFKVINKKTIIHLTKNSKKNIKKGLKRMKYLYKESKITFGQLFSSIETYKNSYKLESKQVINNIIDLNW